MLNLSGKIDQDTVELLGVVDQVAKDLGVSYLVVGATARDMVMHYGYGARVQRATVDLDLAIQLPDWQTYTNVTHRLVGHGFKKDRAPQRIYSPADKPIDLVPFGGIADENLNIQWPTPSEAEMDVTGFDEAHACAIQVIAQEDPTLNVPVASPQGLALLKLIAWSDRAKGLRQKDAKDIAYLLETYQNVDQVRERTFDIDGLMESYDWNLDLGTAHLLGLDTAGVARPKTRDQVIGVMDKNFEPKTPNLLAEEMCSRGQEGYADKLKLLEAFSNGLRA